MEVFDLDFDPQGLKSSVMPNSMDFDVFAYTSIMSYYAAQSCANHSKLVVNYATQCCMNHINYELTTVVEQFIGSRRLGLATPDAR
jgi:hypothetical protein